MLKRQPARVSSVSADACIRISTPSDEPSRDRSAACEPRGRPRGCAGYHARALAKRRASNARRHGRSRTASSVSGCGRRIPPTLAVRRTMPMAPPATIGLLTHLPSAERASRHPLATGTGLHRRPVRRAPVAQLDRAPDYESGGQRFESFRARHFRTELRTPGAGDEPTPVMAVSRLALSPMMRITSAPTSTRSTIA